METDTYVHNIYSRIEEDSLGL